MKVAVIGPVCKDEIIIKGRHIQQMGGLTYYAGCALSALAAEVTIFGSFGQEKPAWLKQLRCQKLIRIPAPKTLKFINEYSEANQDVRSQRAEFSKNEIRTEDIRKYDFSKFDYIILGPLFHDNISLDLVRHLHKSGSKIVLAPQGLIRYLDNQKIIWKNPKLVIKMLKYFHCLVLDEKELKFISQKNKISRAVDYLLRHGAKNMVITRGSSGSYVIVKGKQYCIKVFKPRRLIDPTGAGDSYLAGFIKAQEWFKNPQKQGEFAAMVATMAMENHGPFNGNSKKVLNRLGRSSP